MYLLHIFVYVKQLVCYDQKAHTSVLEPIAIIIMIIIIQSTANM